MLWDCCAWLLILQGFLPLLVETSLIVVCIRAGPQHGECPRMFSHYDTIDLTHLASHMNFIDGMLNN